MINIQSNVNVRKYTTMKIGGIVKYFVEVYSLNDIKEVLKFIENNKLKFFILGNGSNVLINDKYFDGCVIRINKNYSHFEVVDKDKIEVSSGYLLSSFINKCRNLGFSSLEDMYGIPATIGGCIHGNAGVNSISIGDKIVSVKVIHNGKLIELSKEECKFSYRNSLFKYDPSFIIVSAIILVKKIDKCQLDNIIVKTIKKRILTQPISLPSCGCVFKNVGNVSSWKYIKSLDIVNDTNRAYISDMHASFIINGGEASFKDVYNLIETIKNSVYYIYNIMLVCELEIIDWR